jgi:hypothetical protein
VLVRHGEEPGIAARLEPRGHWTRRHDSAKPENALGGRALAAEMVEDDLLEQAAKARSWYAGLSRQD